VPFVVGLTGNIACGKSTVGQWLADKYGADYVDADRLVHALYATGTPETAAIATRFGEDLLAPDGTINRRRLGDIVMSSEAALRELEAILDPGVMRAIQDRLAHTDAKVVVLDAIRLVESGIAQRCDAIWVVICEQQLQIQRLQASRNFTVEQARIRVAAQRSADEKIRHADAVIENNSDLSTLKSRIDHAWAKTVAPAIHV
jgi:dephospho-CoA kinase